MSAERRLTGFRSPAAYWPAALLAVTLLLYVRVVGFEFINFDDDVHVYENPHVRAGLTWDGLIWAFGIHGPSQWHPLAWASHQFDWELFGNNPAGHHVTNVALHALGVALLFAAMNSLLGRPGTAAFIAAMFAVHPLNIESVAWISERRNVLCGVCWMAALIAYAGYARHGGARRYTWVTLWLALALMSKPLAVTLPCVFALLDFWPLRRCPLPAGWQPTANLCAYEPCPTQSWWTLILEKSPWVVLSAGAAWLSYLCQEKIQVVSDLATLPLYLRLENAMVAYGLYLRRMIWPTDLAVFYPHPAWHHPHPERVLLLPAIVSVAALLAISVVAVRQLRRRPGLAVGWCWFLGTLVPMIGIVQVGQQQLADRYAYVPMIGLGLMLVSCPVPTRLAQLSARFAIVAAAAWFAVSVWQLSFWRNSQALFARTAAITNDNSWARLNLGLALQGEGKYAEAIESYQQALQIDPNYVLAHYNLGIAWQDLGRLELAVRHFETAIALNDRDVKAWLRLGGALGQAGNLPRAESCFRKALMLDERSAQARFNLGLTLLARGRPEDGLTELQESAALEPDSLHFRTGLMQALVEAGRIDEARAEAHEILRQDPKSAAAQKILMNHTAP